MFGITKRLSFLPGMKSTTRVLSPIPSRRPYSPLPVTLPVSPASITPTSPVTTSKQTSPSYTTNLSTNKQSKPSRFKRFLNKAKNGIKKIANLPFKYPTIITSIGIITTAALGILNPGIAILLLVGVTITKGLFIVYNDKQATYKKYKQMPPISYFQSMERR